MQASWSRGRGVRVKNSEQSMAWAVPFCEHRIRRFPIEYSLSMMMITSKDWLPLSMTQLEALLGSTQVQNHV